jgi:hypothetical protein
MSRLPRRASTFVVASFVVHCSLTYVFQLEISDVKLHVSLVSHKSNMTDLKLHKRVNTCMCIVYYVVIYFVDDRSESVAE